MITQAITDVLAERQRQIEVEGWEAAHDDSHRDASLAEAAVCYASNYASRAFCSLAGWTPACSYEDAPAPAEWPWDESMWKPKNPRRDLVRAAALLIAEIERLDRKGLP